MKKVKREPYYCEQRQSWVVPLTRGCEALIDECSLKLVDSMNWSSSIELKAIYAKTSIDGKIVGMHRIITSAPAGKEVDHINGNTLDNRVSNLRICTTRENQQNQTKHRNGKLVGCSFDAYHKAWKSGIRIDGKFKHLGYFKTEFEAHERYMEEYKKISGL